MGVPAHEPRRFRRRGLFAAAGAGAAALGLRPLRGAGPAAARAAKPPKRFATKLPIPRVLDGAELTIPMREAEVPVLPGRPTRMWTYDGEFPGPTIRRPAGQETRVTFAHELPAEAGELTVHLHGGHNRSEHDGQPGGLTESQPRALYCDLSARTPKRQSGNDLLIFPGTSRTYVYDLIEDGGPERAAFQWYHDHRLERTARNVWRGLAGMWILDDDFDASLPLPRGERDLPLMIVDRSFDARNQLTDPFSSTATAPNDGVTGRHVLVNGAYAPFHRVEGCRYRLRLLNASGFRSYSLRLSNGMPMTQIATEAGLMPKPVRRKQILLGPAERVEVIVDFAGAKGSTVELESGPRQGVRGSALAGTKPFVGTLMQFRVGARRPDDTGVPKSLRPLPAWVDDAPVVSRSWKLTVGAAFRPVWNINGKTFDPARSDAFPVLGTTERWTLENKTKVAHAMHMHHADWYMLSRNGKRPPPWENALKETFFLDPGDKVVVAGHFSDFTGKYAIHCHMLDHEDHGLMSQFEVVAPS
jgi:FtsP/CotA-like multicopper oxidase with cupredoxin domain